MKLKAKTNTKTLNLNTDPDAWIERLIDQSMIGLMCVIVVGLVVHIARFFQYGLSIILVVKFAASFAVLGVLLFRHKISGKWTNFAIMASLILVATLAMVQFGMLTPAVVAMAVFPIVVGSSRGTKAAMVVTLLLLVTIVVVALLYSFGFVQSTIQLQTYIHEPINWVFFAAAYAAFVIWGSVLAGTQADCWRTSLRELKASQEETLRERESVAKLQRNESISQLSGGVAHDFNNVLAAMMSNIEVARELNDRNEKPNIVDESLRTALEAAERGSELTRSLLSFANVAVLAPKQININCVVEQSIRWISRTVPENIEIKTSLADDTKLIKVDEASLSSALLNLIINARDAMPDGGSILITTRNLVVSDDADQPGLKNIAAGNYVELSVKDSGIGLDPLMHEKIFEPFYTTKGSSEGSGLGLAMVQGFMKQSGSRVTVTSELGKGAMFQLVFPVSERALLTKVATAEVIADRKPGFNGASVMIVEDEPGIASSLQIMLEYAGYKVRTAVNGDVAWQALLEEPGIDLVISDIVMSGKLQGTDLARKIHEALGLPVILMSGYAFTLKEGINQNAVGQFLEKPIRKAVLINAIETELEKRGPQVAPPPFEPALC